MFEFLEEAENMVVVYKNLTCQVTVSHPKSDEHPDGLEEVSADRLRPAFLAGVAFLTPMPCCAAGGRAEG